MFCSSCGSPLPSGSQFCTQCGARVAPAPDALCPACGKTVPAGMRFCIFCGAPMTAPSAAAPAPTVAGSPVESEVSGSSDSMEPAASPAKTEPEIVDSTELEPTSADSSVPKEPDFDSSEPEPSEAFSEFASNASTFQFVCPHCGQGLEVEKSLAGQTGECPTCGKPVVVPSPEAISVPPSLAPSLLPTQSGEPSLPPRMTEADSPVRSRPTGIFAAVKWGVITGLSLLALVILSSAACGGWDSALTSKSFCYLLGGTVVVVLVTGLLTALALFSGGVSELFRNLGLLAVPALLFSVFLVLAGIFLIYALKNSKDPLPYHQHVKTCPFCGSTSVPLEHGAQCPRCGHTV